MSESKIVWKRTLVRAAECAAVLALLGSCASDSHDKPADQDQTPTTVGAPGSLAPSSEPTTTIFPKSGYPLSPEYVGPIDASIFPETTEPCDESYDGGGIAPGTPIVHAGNWEQLRAEGWEYLTNESSFGGGYENSDHRELLETLKDSYGVCNVTTGSPYLEDQDRPYMVGDDYASLGSDEVGVYIHDDRQNPVAV